MIIYDTQNKMKPLECHGVDGQEFLAHPSKRWTTTPDVKVVKKEIKDDSGEAMRIKSLTFNQLKSMAKKSNIKDFDKMKKAELADALINL